MTPPKSIHSFPQVAPFVTALFYHYSAKCQFSEGMPFTGWGYISLEQLNEHNDNLVVIVSKGNNLSGPKRYLYHASIGYKLDLLKLKDSLGYDILYPLMAFR